MKKMIFGIFLGIFVSALYFNLAVSASSSIPSSQLPSTQSGVSTSHITLIVNNCTIVPDTPPQMINGRLMVPARALAEALGCTVTWNDKINAVIISSNNNIKKEQTNVTPTNTITPNKTELPKDVQEFLDAKPPIAPTGEELIQQFQEDLKRSTQKQQ